MGEINWMDYCIPCRNWCCKGENPFASGKELESIGTSGIGQNNDGSCQFLNQAGACSIYEKRPFECRIFPLDIQEIGGKLHWVAWKVCPAGEALDIEERIADIENDFPKQWPLSYLKDYVLFHKSRQPQKYSEHGFRIIREVRYG